MQLALEVFAGTCIVSSIVCEWGTQCRPPVDILIFPWMDILNPSFFYLLIGLVLDIIVLLVVSTAMLHLQYGVQLLLGDDAMEHERFGDASELHRRGSRTSPYRQLTEGHGTYPGESTGVGEGDVCL